MAGIGNKSLTIWAKAHYGTRTSSLFELTVSRLFCSLTNILPWIANTLFSIWTLAHYWTEASFLFKSPGVLILSYSISDGQFEQADPNGPFVPYFYQQSILETRSSSRCFETFISTHIESIVNRNSGPETSTDGSAGRNAIEVGQFFWLCVFTSDH